MQETHHSEPGSAQEVLGLGSRLPAWWVDPSRELPDGGRTEGPLAPKVPSAFWTLNRDAPSSHKEWRHLMWEKVKAHFAALAHLLGSSLNEWARPMLQAASEVWE